MSNTTDKDWLLNELRQGSEAKHYQNRLTPDGKEMVEMIPIEWAVETLQAIQSKMIAKEDILRAVNNLMFEPEMLSTGDKVLTETKEGWNMGLEQLVSDLGLTNEVSDE